MKKARRLLMSAAGRTSELSLGDAGMSSLDARQLQDNPDPFRGVLLAPEPAMPTLTMPYASESWRIVWREAFAPGLPTAGLEALRDALRSDDGRLVQNSTTVPPPLECVRDWPVEAGCLLGFMGAVVSGGFGTATVGDAEEFFAKACFDADQRMGEAAACRWLLNWYDDTPRDEMRSELLAEVELVLAARGEG